ncbi:MAG: OmpA family protein [candidate division WOR-3 bacterium]
MSECLILLVLISFPSTFGGKGVYRIKSGDIEWLLDAHSILVLNIDAEGYRYDYTDSTVDFASGRIGIGYTPLKFLEGYTLWRVHGGGNAQLPVTESDFEGDLGDTDIGLKTILKKINNSFIGTDFSLTLPTGRRQYSNDGIIFYPKLLTTFDLGDFTLMLPLRCHLNLGIPLGRKDLSENFPLTLGVAWELPSKFFTYFMELTRNHERDWNWRFSPGLKFHPFYRISFTAVADLGLVRDYWLFGANVGLSFNSSLTKEREILPTGNIAGEVRDKNTNKPLAAEIEVIEIGEKIHANPEYGVYKIVGLPKGIYTLKVHSSYYSPETRVVVVEANESTILNFALIRAEVVYNGIVKDSRTNEPISGATINILGETKVSLLSDEKGQFYTTLVPGEYEITANKLNYSQFKTKVSITDDREETILLKSIEVATEVGETPEAIVYFDLDDANVRDDQKPTLDTIAEFLKSHPTVKCELRGHTDKSGDINYNQILSLARANSVMDYLVKVHGIEKERISTMAFSKTRPVKESPEKSRRVEIFLTK